MSFATTENAGGLRIAGRSKREKRLWVVTKFQARNLGLDDLSRGGRPKIIAEDELQEAIVSCYKKQKQRMRVQLHKRRRFAWRFHSSKMINQVSIAHEINSIAFESFI